MRWLQRNPSQAHAQLDARAPLRRSDDLVIEQLDDELLVYDRTNKRAHCLSADAALVWRACDGNTGLTAISAHLGLPRDVVRQALDELEASGLLDPGLELVNVVPANGNGRPVTRREMAARSAKVGTAIAATPLILSITAPTAMAAATPTPFQCHTYTTQDCGTDAGCGAIAGCCCCCQGSTAQCKLCSSTSLCEAGNESCAVEYGGTLSNCSTIGTGGTVSGQGCCGVTGSKNCGCGFGVPRGTAGTGAANGGAGCCNPTTGAACTPGDTNCVPCCNGSPIGPSARLACCVSGPTTTCPTT